MQKIKSNWQEMAKWRRYFLLAAAFLFITTTVYFVVNKINGQAKAAWWNDVWQYRKTISISSGSSAASGYQVKINDYNTSTPITAGKMQSNCGDLRFTSASGVELKYWVVEGTCNTSTTDIWVGVNDIPASGGTTIYMYYGNPSADNKSDIKNTFIKGDDFEDLTLDRNIWQISAGGGTISETGGAMQFDIASGATADCWGGTSESCPIAYTSVPNTGDWIAVAKLKSYTVNVETHSGLMLYDDRDNIYLWGRYNSTITGHNDFTIEKIVSNTSTNAVSLYSSTTLPMYLGIRKIGSTKYYTYSVAGDTFTDQYNTTELTGNYVGMFAKHWTTNTISAPYEYLYVRKYMSTEPAAGSPGSEEQSVDPVAYWSFDEGYSTTVHNQMERKGENGLISWWKFNDAASGTSPAPQDTMGYVTSSWVGDASYTSTSHLGNAAALDGTGDYINAGTAINLANRSFTVSAWAKRASSGSNHYIIGLGDTNATDQSLHFGFRDTNVFTCAFFSDDLNTTATYTDSNWHLWTCTYNTLTKLRKIYQDGVEVASGIASANFQGSGTFYIGRVGWGNSYHFNGQVDEVKVYNRVLSSGEITGEYNSLNGTMLNMDPTTDWVEGAKPNSKQRALGKALDFDGTDDEVIIPATSTLPDILDKDIDMSLCTWIYPTSTPGDTATIYGKNELYHDAAITYRTDNKVEIWYYTSGNEGVASTNIAPLNTWSHVCMTQNGTTKENIIYLNSVNNGSFTRTKDVTTSVNLRIGGITSGATNRHFPGRIDEVKVFSKVLTPDQIKKEFNRSASVVLGAGVHAGQGAPPVGFWKLDEGSGYATFDSSGNNNNGIMKDMDPTSDWVQGKVGKALDFDGSNDYVSTGSNINLANSSFSLSVWAKRGGTGTTDHIIKLGDTYSTDNLLHFGFRSSNYFTCAFFSDDLNSPSAYTDTDWHHWTCTYDASSNARKLYKDGVLISSDTATADFQGTGSLYFGLYSTDYYLGQIDHIKIYNYARTPEQVHYDMATGSPIAYYSFDEGTSTTLHNSQETNGEYGLISWWKFDDAASGTSPAPQDTMKVNNATWNGSTAAYTGTAKIGNGATFTATNSDYVSVADNSTLDITGDITMSAWVRPTTLNTYNIVMGKRESGSNNPNYLLSVNGTGTINMNFYAGGTVHSYTTSSTPISVNNWYHIVATYDGISTVKIFVNGVLQAASCTSGTCTGAITPNAADFAIGRPGSYAANYFTGQIDEVRIYDRPITTSEVTALYNSLQGHMLNMDPASDWVEGARQNPQQKALGKALDFDGSNDYVTVTNTLEDLRTISLWIKPTSSTTSLLDFDGGTHYLSLSSGTVSATGFSTPAIYINGTLNGTVTAGIWNHILVQTETSFDVTALTIGKQSSNYYTGQLDEVKIYNYLLSSNELKTDYSRGAAMVLGAGKSEADTAGSSLVGWWKLDEGSGYTAFDSSGKNNNGVLSNMDPASDWIAAKLGKGLDFDGSNDYVGAGNGINLANSSFSASAWARRTGPGTTRYIFSLGETAANNNMLIVGFRNTNVFTCAFYYNDLDTPVTYSDTNWHHWVCTYNAATNARKIYLDGVEVASDTATADFQGTGNFYIGKWLTTYFLGQIDNVKIWNKTLSINEIAWEYNQGAPLYHWSFDDGAGIIAANAASPSVPTDGLVGFWALDNTGTVVDLSGNGNDLANATSSATLGTGIKSGALSFPITNKSQYYCTDANCGADLDYQGNGLTVSTWVKATNLAEASWKNIVIKHYYNSSTDNGGYTFSTYTDGRPFFLVRNSSGTSTQCDVYGTAAISTTEWQHLVGTYDGKTCRMYVNGVLTDSENYSGGIKNVSQHFAVGGNDGGNFMFNGLIDHTKVWQRALSAREVSLEYVYDEKYGYLNNMDAATDWVAGAWPSPNRPKLGKALDFDGSNDFLSAYRIPWITYNGTYSFSAWIKPTGSGDYVIFQNSNSASDRNGIRISSGTLRFGYYNGTSWIGASGNVNANQWQHIVGVNNAGTLSLYINGILQSGTENPYVHSDSTSLYLGKCTNAGTEEYYNGQLDEIKVYNYPLTAEQVKLDYNNRAAVRF